MLTIEQPTDGISVITLRWTEKRNALNPDDARVIADAIDQATSESDCVILTGEGAFCSGGDLRAFAEISATKTHGEIRDHVYRDVQRMFRSIELAPVPVIAAVDGPAVGLGMDLALAADMCVVGPSGWLQQGWGRAGLIAGTGGVSFLQTTAPGLVWRLLATQERLDAQTCAELGLAEVATLSGLTQALGRAQDLIAMGHDVLSAYVRLARPLTWPAPEHFALAAETQARFIGSAQFRELAARVLGG